MTLESLASDHNKDAALTAQWTALITVAATDILSVQSDGAD